MGHRRAGRGNKLFERTAAGGQRTRGKHPGLKSYGGPPKLGDIRITENVPSG